MYKNKVLWFCLRGVFYTYRLSGDYHSRVVEAIKRKEFGDINGQAAAKKRKKKGVNPLSCLKKKPKQKVPKKTEILPNSEESNAEKKKKKRNRKRKKAGKGGEGKQEN